MQRPDPPAASERELIPPPSIPSRRRGLHDVFDEDAIRDFIIWNAPDHEYTRRALREKLEELLTQEFKMYELHGGDAAQGLA